MAIDTTAAPSTPPTVDHVVWYRHHDQVNDHAFGVGPGWMRSKCSDVRWTVLMHPVEGTVRPCTECLAAMAPTESEQRLLDGNR